MSAAPAVRLEGGDAASGLAFMIGDLIEGNLRDFPARRRVASRTRGQVALEASDRAAAITLSFRPGEVVVAEGISPDTPVLSGEWLTMAQMCSGQISPVRALASKQLSISGMSNPMCVAAAGFVLSVPESFYEPEAVAERRRKVLIWALAATAVSGGAFGGYWALARRRSGAGGSV